MIIRKLLITRFLSFSIVIQFNSIQIPGIWYINNGMILDEIGDIHRFFNPNNLLAPIWIRLFISLVTFRLRQLICPNVTLAYYATLLLMQLVTLLETTLPLRLITMPKWLNASLTTITWALSWQACQSHLEDAHRQCRI